MDQELLWVLWFSILISLVIVFTMWVHKKGEVISLDLITCIFLT